MATNWSMDNLALSERIVSDFTYRAPHGDQVERYTLIRSAALDFAQKLMAYCPNSRELSLALTHLEESTFWANASIARNEP